MRTRRRRPRTRTATRRPPGPRRRPDAAWRDGDLESARKIWDGGLAELHEYVYEQWGRLHVRYKIATWLRGLIGLPDMRPPMPLPRRAEVHELRRLLDAASLPVRDEGSIEALLRRLPR